MTNRPASLSQAPARSSPLNDALAHERLPTCCSSLTLGDLYNRRWGKCAHQEHPELASQSEHTAKTDVAHILQKLNLRDRTQAGVVAYESGLVQHGTA